jgi:hypothetical protein
MSVKLPKFDLRHPPEALRFPHFTKGRKDAEGKVVYPYCEGEMALVPNELGGDPPPEHLRTYVCRLCGTRSMFW